MLRVRDIMTPHVVTLEPEATLREAIETLVTCRIGGAPVIERGKIVGVLSAPDILEFESITPGGALDADEEADQTDDGAEPWRDDDESPATYFTELWTDRSSELTERFGPAESPHWDLLEEHTVTEAMSRSICALPDMLEVSAAAQRMLAAGVQRALVTENEELVGILTTTDILRAVAERRLSVRQYVFE